MDKVTLNNAIGLLGECLVNGDEGAAQLYAWFCGERHLISETIKDVSQQSQADVIDEK